LNGSGPANERSRLGSFPVRLHHYLPLSVPPAHHGAGSSAGDLQSVGAAHRGRLLRRGRSLLGKDLRPELRTWRRHRNPNGASIRDELGSVLSLRWRSDRRDLGAGGHVRLLRRVGLSRIVSVRRTAPGTEEALSHYVDVVPRLLAVWLFHRGHQRLHAVSAG